MFLTGFYAPLLPIGLVYTLICLFFYYYITKWSFITGRRIVKESLDKKISEKMTDILELFLPVYCFGNLIFSTILSNTYAQKTFKDWDI